MIYFFAALDDIDIKGVYKTHVNREKSFASLLVGYMLN